MTARSIHFRVAKVASCVCARCSARRLACRYDVVEIEQFTVLGRYERNAFTLAQYHDDDDIGFRRSG